jgi:glycolate oxidase FAD binding subunit
MSEATLNTLIDQVRSAAADNKALNITGGNTKHFYGEDPRGEPLTTTEFKGITAYEPHELFVTARCGTPLTELEATLAEKGQCLAFEPPRFAEGSTIGGMVAAGLSGPSRASVGSVRDHVLGATLLSGKAEVLTFGGQVIKNVAGYDVSRLLAGSMGTLGLILDVSLKVLPMSPATATLRFRMDQAAALTKLNEWGGQALPLNASAWWDGSLLLRLRGAMAAVRAAMTALGGEVIDPVHASEFWQGLRDHQDEYFVNAQKAVAGGSVALWRLSVPQTAAPLVLPGEQLIEWHGAQRWICTSASGTKVREAAERAGGHAVLFMAMHKDAGAFAPLAPPLDRIHRDLKTSFDPSGIFNPGRLYPEF